MEFYSKLYVALNNNHPKNIDEIIKVWVKGGAFKEFKISNQNISKQNWSLKQIFGPLEFIFIFNFSSINSTKFYFILIKFIHSKIQ